MLRQHSAWEILFSHGLIIGAVVAGYSSVWIGCVTDAAATTGRGRSAAMRQSVSTGHDRHVVLMHSRNYGTDHAWAAAAATSITAAATTAATTCL